MEELKINLILGKNQQITNTTDYAHRIIDYLSEKGNLATEAELADI